MIVIAATLPVDMATLRMISHRHRTRLRSTPASYHLMCKRRQKSSRLKELSVVGDAKMVSKAQACEEYQTRGSPQLRVPY